MPVKQTQRLELNSFVGGLITEASPLNFPQNASWLEKNFELLRDGSRRRRKGMDFDTLYNLPIEPDQGSFETIGKGVFKWQNPGGRSGAEFMVIQVGQSLHIYNIVNVENVFSDKWAEIKLNSYRTNITYSIAGIEGMLVVAAGEWELTIIRVDSWEDKTFTTETKSLHVRDVWGIQETDPRREEDPRARMRGLDVIHSYNLRNQSWGQERYCEVQVPIYGPVLVTKPNPAYNPLLPEGPDNPKTIQVYEQQIVGHKKGTAMADPVRAYMEGLWGNSPSNGETIWAGMQVQAVTKDQEPFEKLFPKLLQQVFGAEPLAPKGFFVIDALKRGESRAWEYDQNQQSQTDMDKHVPDFPKDETKGGANIVAEFSGRVFYSGFNGEVEGGDVRSPNFSNMILFSQLVRSSSEIVKCYQEGDPTSREGNDVVDTDGGFLKISGAHNIIALENLGSILVVFAENGVWTITGGGDYGFSATNYKVTKLSSTGVFNRNSIVNLGDSALYWADEGIFVLQKDQYGDYVENSVTDNTIKKFYHSISDRALKTSTGAYDTVTGQVRWVYYEDTPEGFKTTELILDRTLGAFALNEILPNEGHVACIFSIFQGNSAEDFEFRNEVFVGGVDVVSGGDDVIVTERVNLGTSGSIRYLTYYEREGRSYIGSGNYFREDYRDWSSLDGTGRDAEAFIITGKDTGGDSAINKQIPYLIVHMMQNDSREGEVLEAGDQSGCLVQGQWGFTNSVSGRWTPPIQAFRPTRVGRFYQDQGKYIAPESVVSTKVKLRGRGNAYSLMFKTEPNKHCHILGWNVTMTGNPQT